MLFQTYFFTLFALVVAVNAVALQLKQRANSTLTFITQTDPDPASRASAIAVKKNGYLYGPSLIGNGSFFLAGPLGSARVNLDVSEASVDLAYVNTNIANDINLVKAAVGINGGLNSLDDYARILYDGQWRAAIPAGESPGSLTNYTQDLFFSMERLSLNPYPLRRLKVKDALPFTIPDATSIKISGLSLVALKNLGRLFVVDHSYQAKYDKTAKFGAACTALFYICPATGDFLPLAIKTNTGSDLTYTPLDLPSDWLLAKMMFNVNDLFHAEAFHLTAFHDVGEILHEAALRTLSDNHPVMVLLDRLMFLAYSVRPIGEARLFNPGGSFDTAFYISQTGARQYVTESYPKIGAVKAGYFETDLKARGLIKASWGPDLKHFPYYEDVSTVTASIKTFITSFIKSYYDNDSDMAADTELAAWFLEASTAAQVIDFPCSPIEPTCTRADLIRLLTHIAHLTGVAHHVLNTGDLTLSLGVLPFHPAALYAPLPTAKNISSVLPWLPPIPAALFQITLMAAFNRPQYEAQNKTLAWAYSDPGFLGRFNAKVTRAAAKYQADMFEFSKKVRARVFDGSGLSQGMPFIWKGVDPGTIPWFFAI